MTLLRDQLDAQTMHAQIKKSQTVLRHVYFGQADFYLSQSKETTQKIDTMPPRYAANAARRMLRDAPQYAADAGVDTEFPELWITTTVLFQALTWRAGI